MYGLGTVQNDRGVDIMHFFHMKAKYQANTEKTPERKSTLILPFICSKIIYITKSKHIN